MLLQIQPVRGIQLFQLPTQIGQFGIVSILQKPKIVIEQRLFPSAAGLGSPGEMLLRSIIQTQIHRT
ncbi:hypothetical protein Pa4123_20570 [Phytohabitans aurantiacus]|uniref:Uncharacterized protein n=1 Tax=Phytohabitans aurantiacus TaxID=3016789 RepID=A0ABQ5QQM0_9ACTN|nr:hypothetical protein Pa4123_20570 [Phytohabitans aurantiacus]